MKKIGICALAALMMLTIPPALAEEAAMTETPRAAFNEGFYNPICSEMGGGDPWMIQHEGVYYYTQSAGTKIAVTRSESISGLMNARAETKTIYLGSKNDQTQLWAPELHFYQGRWYCCYAADYNDDNRQHRMYVLRSKTGDVMGEWEYGGKLDLPEDQWAIDGTFFEYEDGRIFHIWSGWKNEAQGTSLWKQYLYITELVTGDPTKVLSTQRVMIAKPQYYWEMSRLPQNEGPAILRSPDGTYYCMYAGNYSGSDDYTVGMVRLTGDDPMDADAWEKLPEPLLASAPERDVYAPGHASFTKSADGTENWIIFHTAKASGSGWDRCMHAQKLSWVEDTPYVEELLGRDTVIPLPSGERVNRVLYQAEDGRLSEGAMVADGPGGGKSVHFTTSRESCSLTINAPQAGVYGLNIRYSNSDQLENQLFLTVGKSRRALTLPRSGESFTMTCAQVKLEEGLNTLTFSAGPRVNLDLVILDLNKK